MVDYSKSRTVRKGRSANLSVCGKRCKILSPTAFFCKVGVLQSPGAILYNRKDKMGSV